MNNKPACHPENHESGQQANRQANLDTSERGTLVPPHPQNGIKNTEMTTNQPKVDNLKTCGTCAYYHEERPNAVMPAHFCGLWGQVRLPQYNACDFHTPAHEPEHP